MTVKKTEPTDILEAVLENPPTDRALDAVWGDGVSGSSQRLLQWRIVCRGGTLSALAGEIPAFTARLAEAKENLEIVVARCMKREAAELRHLMADLVVKIAERTAIVEAAGCRIETDERGKVAVKGGWVDCDMRALQRAVGQAEFNLREAAGKVDPYRERWPPIREFEKRFALELREVEKAQAAFKAAQKALSEGSALLEADRAKLLALRHRAAA